MRDVRKRPPTALFHYSSLEGDRLTYMRDLVVRSKLYFASPGGFNDPLDCRIPPSFDCAPQIAEAYWSAVAGVVGSEMTADEHTRRVAERVLESTTAEGRERLASRFLDLLTKRGVVCLATDPLSRLMWSYYANKHKGIAVRFNMCEDNLRQLLAHTARPLPLQVDYRDEFPALNYYDGMRDEDSIEQFIHTILSTKARAWEHEGEWRIVLNDHVGLIDIPPALVDGVVLGMETSKDDQATVREWCKERKIELLKVVAEPRSFKLTLQSA